jgi:hypothetical protein
VLTALSVIVWIDITLIAAVVVQIAAAIFLLFERIRTREDREEMQRQEQVIERMRREHPSWFQTDG